jgi:hypothetical protein
MMPWMERAIWSVAPPALNGTMISTGFVGSHACATPAPPSPNENTANGTASFNVWFSNFVSSAALRRMFISLVDETVKRGFQLA